MAPWPLFPKNFIFGFTSYQIEYDIQVSILQYVFKNGGFPDIANKKKA